MAFLQSPPQISTLLKDWTQGDTAARDDLFRRLYDDLKILAHRARMQKGRDASLDSTALLHELYLKFARGRPVKANDRAHFLCIASKALRHVLVDYARSRRRLKRNNEVLRLGMGMAAQIGFSDDARADDVLAINDAVTKLSGRSMRQAEVVELHFFGGLTYEEIASALGVTKKTVYRDWVKAKSWLRQELGHVR